MSGFSEINKFSSTSYSTAWYVSINIHRTLYYVWGKLTYF